MGDRRHITPGHESFGLARRRETMRFWRHPELTFLEARETRDGREVCYARHSHDSFSLGAVTGGRSLYEYQVPGGEAVAVPVSRGAVVAMNPREVHACNPVDDVPWSYVMFYLDPEWLAGLQRRQGTDLDGGFRSLTSHHLREPALYRALVALGRALFEDGETPVELARRCTALCTALFARVELYAEPTGDESTRLARLVEFIRGHCTEPLTLERMAAEAELTPSHLVRVFKRHYGITPHAFLTDCRIRYGQAALKLGKPISEVALACQFADQAHFQRTFKRFTAITPYRYRQTSSGRE